MTEETDLSIREMQTDLKWIRQKMESYCDETKCLREDCKKTDGRVSALENWRSGIVACLALLTVLIGWGWISPGMGR